MMEIFCPISRNLSFKTWRLICLAPKTGSRAPGMCPRVLSPANRTCLIWDQKVEELLGVILYLKPSCVFTSINVRYI